MNRGTEHYVVKVSLRIHQDAGHCPNTVSRNSLAFALHMLCGRTTKQDRINRCEEDQHVRDILPLKDQTVPDYM